MQRLLSNEEEKNKAIIQEVCFMVSFWKQTKTFPNFTQSMVCLVGSFLNSSLKDMCQQVLDFSVQTPCL